MANSVLPRIPLKSISNTPGEFRYSLTDAFFNELDQEDLAGGEIEVNATVTKDCENQAYSLDFSIKGFVKVACDRCLDELQIPIEAHDQVKLVMDEEETSDSDFVRTIDRRMQEYDMSDDIFQLIELSLPIQRVHDEGSCNEEMLNVLREHSRKEE